VANAAMRHISLSRNVLGGEFSLGLFSLSISLTENRFKLVGGFEVPGEP